MGLVGRCLGWNGPFSISNAVQVKTNLTDGEKKEFGDLAKTALGKKLQTIGHAHTIVLG